MFKVCFKFFFHQPLLSLILILLNQNSSSIQLIKRDAIIENDKKFHSQVRVISLADSSPYETLHSYVSNTLAPYFKSYIKRNEMSSKMADANSSSSRGLSAVSGTNEPTSNGMNGGGPSSAGDQATSLMEKKIAEVEMGFLHLQQNIEIPEINLIIHPIIIQMIKKCQEENRKPKVDDFANKVEDTNFLNQLQSGVSRWIREIKKVTKLDRDFPLNELISATELNKITAAIVSILSHLKKINSSKYPLVRTLKLIEAISKDLTNQLLKVLSTKRFMVISFDDFEKTMKVNAYTGFC